MNNTKIISQRHEWEINITPVLSNVTFHDYKRGNLYRIELKEEVLIHLTRNLFRPKVIRDDEQKLLQQIEGMIVIASSSNTYVFVGYLKIPLYYLRTSFDSSSMLTTKPYVNPNDTTDTLTEAFEKVDYSVPYNTVTSEGGRHRITKDVRKRCFRSYIEEGGSTKTRSRGEYYCIFHLGTHLVAVSRKNFFDLTDTNVISGYTQDALRFIYTISGLDFEKFRKGDYTSNHTEYTFVLASVRDPTNVFYRDARSTQNTSIEDECLFDVHYISSSLQSCFYLTSYRIKEFLMYFNITLDNNEGEKIVPAPSSLWMKHFVGAKSCLSERSNVGNNSDMERYNREYPCLEVYSPMLKTNLVYCSEKEYLIDMLTIEDSSIFAVARKILSFYRDKKTVTFQYHLGWPERYTSPEEMANDLFNNTELTSLITLERSNVTPSEANVINDTCLKGFIRKLCGSDLVRVVKEKVVKQLSFGEYSYVTRSNTGVSRIYLTQYEDYFVNIKCYASLTKTVSGRPCVIRFLCDVSGDPSNTTLKVNLETSNVTSVTSVTQNVTTVTSAVTGSVSNVTSAMPGIRISSTQDKIVKFIYSLVIQREKQGYLDMNEAYRNTLLPDTSSEDLKEMIKEREKLENEVKNEKVMEDEDTFRKRIQEMESESEAMEEIQMYNIEREKRFTRQNRINKIKQMETFVISERTSPIKRTRLPNTLLEKVILKLEHRVDIPITLSEIEEYLKLLEKKSEEFVCSTYSSYGITVETDLNNIIIRSTLLDDTITIPATFVLIPNTDEVEMIKPIETFQKTSVFRKNIPEKKLYLLFIQYGMDYYFFKSLNTVVERSTYLVKLYERMKGSDVGINDFLRVTSNVTPDNTLYVYECNITEHNWKPLSSL